MKFQRIISPTKAKFLTLSLYCLVSMLAVQAGYAQSNMPAWHYYAKLYSDRGSATNPLIREHKTIKTIDNHILTVYNAGNLVVLKSDTFGNIKWVKAYQTDNLDSSGFTRLDAVQHPNGDIAIITNPIATSIVPFLNLLLLNQNGEIKSSRALDIATFCTYQFQIIVGSDLNYKIIGCSGDYRPNFDLGDFMISVKPDGIVENMVLSNPSFNDITPAIIGLHASNSELYSVYYTYDSSVPVGFGISRMRNNLQIRATTYMQGATRTFVPFSIMQLSENKIVLLSQQFIDRQSVGSALVQCLDSNLNLLWSKRLITPSDTAGTSAVCQLSDWGVLDSKLYIHTQSGAECSIDTNGIIETFFDFSPETPFFSTGNGIYGRFISPTPTIGKFIYYQSYKGAELKYFATTAFERMTVVDSAFRCNVPTEIYSLKDVPIVVSPRFTSFRSLQNISFVRGVTLKDTNLTVCRYDNACITPLKIKQFTRVCDFPIRIDSIISKPLFDQKLLWADGDTSYSKTFTREGFYVFTITTPCVTYTDSIQILYNSLQVALPLDTFQVCSGLELPVQAVLPYSFGAKFYDATGKQLQENVSSAKFLWDSTSNKNSVFTKIYLRFSVDGCNRLDSAVVRIIPRYVAALPDTIYFCGDDSLVDARKYYPSATQITWTAPSETPFPYPIFDFKKEGVYGLSMLRAGCPNTDSTYGKKAETEDKAVVFLNLRRVKPDSAEISFVGGDVLTLVPPFGATDVIWSNAKGRLFFSSTTARFTLVQDTMLRLQLSYLQGGCLFKTEFALNFVSGDFTLPNIITPNNDLANDKLTAKGSMPRVGEMMIYNNWGKVVYANANYKGDWPQNSVPSGTYFFVYTYRSAGVQKRKKGWLEIAN